MFGWFIVLFVAVSSFYYTDLDAKSVVFSKVFPALFVVSLVIAFIKLTKRRSRRMVKSPNAGSAGFIATTSSSDNSGCSGADSGGADGGC
ncbi:hypothetical protein N9V74_00515 [Alteromonas sp.]|jgi:hypothetical protein|nr:hypothetical protein [Alteromonas sp.]